MKSLLRRSALVLSLVFAASGLNVLGAGQAFAACPVESGWEVTGKADAWMATTTYSYWLTGPGTISYTESETATRSTSKSASISVSAGWVIARAEAKFSMDWNESTSKYWSWQYNIPVPAGQTARAVVYKRGSRFSVQKWTVNSLCKTTWSPVYYQYSPFASTANTSFCIGKDVSPATTYIFKSACTA
jgi:hypothetical protein